MRIDLMSALLMPLCCLCLTMPLLLVMLTIVVVFDPAAMCCDDCAYK